jgi:hypothetical protein
LCEEIGGWGRGWGEAFPRSPHEFVEERMRERAAEAEEEKTKPEPDEDSSSDASN